METHQQPSEIKPVIDNHSKVDTSRPFSSVKEAVAVFGERFLAGEIYSPKPSYSTNFISPKRETWRLISTAPSTPVKPQVNRGGSYTLANAVKKLETELEETKKELKLLKERESDTEVALASLNAELHKNMSKLAKAEAAAAKAAATRRSSFSERENIGEDIGTVRDQEEGKKGRFVKMESPSLAQILSIGEANGYFGGKKERKITMMKKKKPIIPLVGDLFSRKKESSATTLQNPLYSSTPQVNFG